MEMPVACMYSALHFGISALRVTLGQVSESRVQQWVSECGKSQFPPQGSGSRNNNKSESKARGSSPAGFGMAGEEIPGRLMKTFL